MSITAKHRAPRRSIFEIAETYLFTAIFTAGLIVGAIRW